MARTTLLTNEPITLEEHRLTSDISLCANRKSSTIQRETRPMTHLPSTSNICSRMARCFGFKNTYAGHRKCVCACNVVCACFAGNATSLCGSVRMISVTHCINVQTTSEQGRIQPVRLGGGGDFNNIWQSKLIRGFTTVREMNYTHNISVSKQWTAKLT